MYHGLEELPDHRQLGGLEHGRRRRRMLHSHAHSDGGLRRGRSSANGASGDPVRQAGDPLRELGMAQDAVLPHARIRPPRPL